jgi:hypothetical protein
VERNLAAVGVRKDCTAQARGFVVEHQVNAMLREFVLAAFRGDEVPAPGEGTAGLLRRIRHLASSLP